MPRPSRIRRLRTAALLCLLPLLPGGVWVARPAPATPALAAAPATAPPRPDRQRALAYLARAVALTKGTRDVVEQAGALCTIAPTQVVVGDLAGAKASARTLQKLYEQGQDLHTYAWQGEMWTVIVVAQYKTGDHAGALATARAVPDTDHDARTRALHNLAQAQAKAGDVAGAKRCLRAAATEANNWLIEFALPELAGAQAKAGDLSGGIATAASLKGDGSAGGGITFFLRMQAFENVALALARAGDFAGAKKVVRTRMQQTRDPDVDWTGIALSEIAAVQAARGDIVGAELTLATMPDGYSKATASAAVASARWRAGDRDAARQAFVRATSYAAKLDGSAKETALMSVAIAEVKTGDLDSAAAILKRFRNPDYARQPRLDLATAQWKAGNASAARRTLRRAEPADRPGYDEYSSGSAWEYGLFAATKARIEGFPAAERWIGLRSLPLMRVAGYTALAELLLHPDEPVNRESRS